MKMENSVGDDYSRVRLEKMSPSSDAIPLSAREILMSTI